MRTRPNPPLVPPLQLPGGSSILGWDFLTANPSVASSGEIGPKLLTSRSSDRLDVVHAAAVPLRADLGAAGRSSKLGHRAEQPHVPTISSSRRIAGPAD